MCVTGLRIVGGLALAVIGAATCLADGGGAKKDVPAQPEDKGDKQRRLEELLRDWDKKRAAVGDFRFEYKRTDKNPVRNEETACRGVAAGRMPDRLRVDERGSQGEPTFTLAFTEDELRWDFYERKASYVLAKPAGQRRAALNDPKLWFLERLPYELENWSRLPFLGLSADELKARFTPAITKVEGRYVTLKLDPRTDSEKKRYQEILVVLDTRTIIAWHTRVVEPNDDSHLWSLTKVETAVTPPVSKKMLLKGPPGEGWEEHRIGEAVDESHPAGERKKP